MFENLKTLAPDPILGLNQTFIQDENPNKINLSVGVYQNPKGLTPIFTAVKKAEAALIAAQQTKSYAPQIGDPAFIEHTTRLVFGDALVDSLQDRIIGVMTPGGCGALRMGGELIAKAKEQVTLWVSSPTWANHYPLLESAGLVLKEYDYYNAEQRGVDFSALIESLSNIPQGDAVLLHGCCHNPTGADITDEQWDVVIDILAERDLVPFIDIAYQGFGDGLEEDAYGIRQATERLPEVIIASSCSKNFGVYRERVGAVFVVTQTAEQSNAARSHILSCARRSYSMSPYHGGGVVGHLLSDSALTLEWETELEEVRNRMNMLRNELAVGLNDAQNKIDFEFLARSKGMFCFLGIQREDVLTLRSEFGIYLLESTRINVAGLSEQNLPIIIERVADVITRS